MDSYCLVLPAVIEFAQKLIKICIHRMDSETPQTKEVSPTKGAEIINEDKTPESGQMETKDDAAAAGGGHEDKSDSDTAAEMEEAAGDSTTAASTVAIINDTKEPEGEKIGGGSSPQAEGDKDDAKRDEDTPESDSKKVQSESETEKVPLDAESGEEKEEELPYKVRFDVSRESTEAADEETKVDPTAVAATDTEQGVGTPTKQPLSSIESERKFQVALVLHSLALA